MLFAHHSCGPVNYHLVGTGQQQKVPPGTWDETLTSNRNSSSRSPPSKKNKTIINDAVAQGMSAPANLQLVAPPHPCPNTAPFKANTGQTSIPF